jgi:hypothetical protein
MMSISKYVDKVWQDMARKQLENELNFLTTNDNEKIKLPIDDSIDYLKMYSDTHKTPEEELQDRIDKAIELLDSYKLGKYDYALTPAGLLELEDILRGEDNEPKKSN